MKKCSLLQKTAAVLLSSLLTLSLCLITPLSAKAEKNIVRVLLTKLNLTDQVTLSLDGSYTIGQLSFQRGSKVVLSCASGQIIAYYEGMAFDLGKQAVIRRHAIVDDKENGLRINNAYPLYCGDLYLTIEGGQLKPVLHIPIEEYLLGVVPYEMSDSFPLEALKAQAIAARTYALKKAGSSGAYDLVDNTNDQVYRGYQKENESAAKAVRDTAGICGYDGKTLAICYYTASNGGQVELIKNVWGSDGSDYIAMHEDPYDVENPESVVKRAEILKQPKDGIVGNAAFTQALKELLAEPLLSKGFTGNADDIRIDGVKSITAHTPTGGKDSLVMTYLRFELMVSARRTPTEAMLDDEENMFALPSAAPAVIATPQPTAQISPFIAANESIFVDVSIFGTVEPVLELTINGSNNEIVTVDESDTAFVLSARRYGHGVGMSQRGAQWMAGQYGWSYEQILRFYYPGLTFKKTDTGTALPSPIAQTYLTTPGPAATPTPRPTLMPVKGEVKDGEWRVVVDQISANSSLNLRALPTTNSDILRVLYYGQPLIAMERMPDGWIRVRTDVIEGYVMEKFVTEVK